MTLSKSLGLFSYLCKRALGLTSVISFFRIMLAKKNTINYSLSFILHTEMSRRVLNFFDLAHKLISQKNLESVYTS